MRSFSVQLPAKVADWVGKAALREEKTSEQFLRELVITSAEEEAMPLTVRLQRLDELVKKMGVIVKKTPMQEEKDANAGPLAGEERKKKRDRLVELGMEACDELRKITGSEEAAKEAEFRLQAFMVMARLGSFSAAVIRDQETEDLEQAIAEIEEQNDKFDEKLKEMEKKRREEDAEERERYRHMS